MDDKGKCRLEDARIMILDDNPANLKVLERVLQFNGYEHILLLNDSRQAVRTYLDFQPDLLLLDLKMPYMDGFEVLKALQEIQHDYLPVMMITAQNDQENMLEALGLGALDFISKPFVSQELLSRIRNFLRIRMLNRKLSDNHGKLEQKVQDQMREMGDMQIELVDRLLKAVEFREHETGEHIKRISGYAYMLAMESGRSEEMANMLYQACKMHDIGKIGIPDEILLKAGPLTAEEWEIMKRHTTKGAQILSGSIWPMLQMAETVALTHHEKWDGSGYPHGLRGNEIPFEGRIAAICDVFDALMYPRPYKPAWTLEETLRAMREESGRHFDPELLVCFLHNIEKIVPMEGMAVEGGPI